MATATVPRRRAVELAAILDSAEIQRLIEDLEATKWTGRPGYPIRALLGVALAKSLYAIPTWSRTVALVHEHEALQRALGAVPSVYAAYRFAGKLRAHGELLESCIQRVLAQLQATNPGMGESIAIDASDLPAYANGQRFVSNGGRERALNEYSDPDATWDTARRCRHARAAASTATASMLQFAPSLDCRSRGRCSRPGTMKLP
jgi:hypothetical protein